MRGAEWLLGDELCDRCHISVVPDKDHPEEPITGPGEYEVSWRRYDFHGASFYWMQFETVYVRILPDGSYGSLATTHFPLPSLNPPSDGLIALLDAPTTAHLHVPIPLRLTIRNRHPTRSANITVQLDVDAADAFVVAGLRHGRVPILLPGAEESITWNLIPVECGLVKVPGMKVLDRRSAVQIAGGTKQSQVGASQTQGAGIPAADGGQSEGDEIKVVDVRWEGRADLAITESEGEERSGKSVQRQDAYVLVLP